MNSVSIPHPFPYQGSKREIAQHILPHFPDDVECLFEPFCGASAVSIAAAARGLVKQFYLNDLNGPLMDLWRKILEHPEELVQEYDRLWRQQHPDRKAFFFSVRDEFNATHQPHHLLYLLARIVKGSVRYNTEGAFNQSADNRRSGMHPKTMRHQIFGVSGLLSGQTVISAKDFRKAVVKVKPKDLIYMDPPYQGTSFTRDQRYYNGLSYDDFVSALEKMNEDNISYIVSYDGQTGNRVHGKKLPESLGLKHLPVYAGRSSQATLLGNEDETVESLYLSPALVKRLQYTPDHPINAPVQTQKELFAA